MKTKSSYLSMFSKLKKSYVRIV